MARLLGVLALLLVVGSDANLNFGNQKCGDPTCSTPLSIGRTVLNYRANDALLLSFKNNEEVKILSKGTSDNNEYWGVEINGRRGFANKRNVQERQILVREPSFDSPFNTVEEVPTQQEQQPVEQTPSDNVENLSVENGEITVDDSPPPATDQPPVAVTDSPDTQGHAEQGIHSVTEQPHVHEVDSHPHEQHDHSHDHHDHDHHSHSHGHGHSHSHGGHHHHRIPGLSFGNPSGPAVPQVVEEARPNPEIVVEEQQQQQVHVEETTEHPQIDVAENLDPAVDENVVELTKRDVVDETPSNVDEFNPEVVENLSDNVEDNLNLSEIVDQQTENEVNVSIISSDNQSETSNENVDNLSNIDAPTLDPSLKDDGSTSTVVESGVVDETVQHYIESSKFFIPEWLHKSLHGRNVETFSPKLVSFLSIISLVLVAIYVICLLFNKLDREKPLKGKLADLDRQLFKARNEALILKREMETVKKSGTVLVAETAAASAPTDVHLYKELEALKTEREQIVAENQGLRIESENQASQKQAALVHVEQLLAKIQSLESSNSKLTQEVADYEAVVQECLEEKRQNKDQLFGGNLTQVVDSLRDQLNSQKETMKKYEGKIKKREAELKERSQEVRKLRADVANANLKADKLSAEKDRIEKETETFRNSAEGGEKEIETLRSKISDLESVRNELIRLKEDIDVKDSEIEDKIRENEVLKETLKSLKLAVSKSARKFATNNNGDKASPADGWEGFDDEIEIDENGDGGDVENENESTFDFSQIEACAQLSVDLKKAQSACEQLSEQLTKAEIQRDQFETQLKEQLSELEMSREAKEVAVKERMEAEQKHDVLRAYFNQREAELQKMLGLQSARLGDAEQGSESTCKQLTLLSDEVESYKAQCKSLKLEMEEQERSLKSQNAQLEKKQHDAWVAMRQESRKFSDAQKEMQGLRTRLTLAETKLVEKEAEILALKEENFGLKEALEKISQQQQQAALNKSDMYSNGNGLLMSGPSSITSDQALPPELPPLPLLPPLLAMPPPQLTAMPPHLLSSVQRPAPLGRKSPTRGPRGYSRSPSPTGRYPPVARYRDISPARSDRSRSRYDSYDEERYSPPSHNYSGARRHSREWSPDRYSSRSERSDYGGDRRGGGDYHRETPSRDLGGRRRSSREDDFAPAPPPLHNNYNSTRLKDRKSDEKQGPKTSSPMVDPYN